MRFYETLRKQGTKLHYFYFYKLHVRETEVCKTNMNYFFAMDVNKNCLNVNMYFFVEFMRSAVSFFYAPGRVAYSDRTIRLSVRLSVCPSIIPSHLR